MEYPRYTLYPTWIEVDVRGWELEGELTDCHPTFSPDFDRDVESAMTWAEGVIGAPQDWRHVRERGFDRWEASQTQS